MSVLFSIVEETYRVVLESGFFLLAGFLLAGVLHEFVDTGRIARHLGGRDLRSIVVATLLGAPLPLCSCGVLPAAVELRKKGASREATVSFLISTPETGVDSIALTYGLLGPLMAVVRPLAAILTGITAGVLSLFVKAPPEEPEPDGAAACCGDCADGGHRAGDGAAPPSGARARLGRVFRYAFVTMMDDLAFWLVVAFVATGLLAGLLPQDFFSRFLPSPFLAVVVMAAIGVPTYVCASASTPVAAAMMARGLNPGAALVFMLTGPATNASTTALVARLFGRRFVAVYVGAIFGVAAVAGVLLDLAIGTGFVPRPVPPVPVRGGLWAGVELVSAFVFLTLLALSIRRRGLRSGWQELAGHGRALAATLRSLAGALRWRPLAAAGAVLLVAVWASTALLVVDPAERGLVTTLGRVTARDLPPGLHLVPPVPFGRAEAVAVARVRTVEVGFRLTPAAGSLSTFVGGRSARIPDEAQFVTGDENVVDVVAVVSYRVADAARFRLGVDRPEAALRDVARSVLIEEIATTTIDAIYSEARGAVERSALARLSGSSLVRDAGLLPLDVRLLYVHAPDEVHAAFRDIASASEDRTRARNAALVEAEGTLGQTRGEVAQQRAEAESARVTAVESARGEASAFVPLAREVAKAPGPSRRRLAIETFERVLPGRPKVIRPRGGKGTLELWVVPGEAAEDGSLRRGFSALTNPLPPAPREPAAPAEEKKE